MEIYLSYLLIGVTVNLEGNILLNTAYKTVKNECCYPFRYILLEF
jgi:hypothetical protein